MLVIWNVDPGDTRHLLSPHLLSGTSKAARSLLAPPWGAHLNDLIATSFKAQPWRCLWRGSEEQITLTTPLRRTTLQLRHIFFTEARTFIGNS